LEQILRQAENQRVIGQVCKRFYRISCSVSVFHTDLRRIFASEKVRRSFFNSSRKIESLAINGLFRDDQVSPDELGEVLCRIGKHAMELKYRDSDAGEMFQFINLMPNIEVIKLTFIKNKNLEVPADFRLNLPKLRQIAFESCSFEVVKIFNHLDDDILDDLSLHSINGSPDGIYFENQRRIRKIGTDVKYTGLCPSSPRFVGDHGQM
jgi:hypothetical protein